MLARERLGKRHQPALAGRIDRFARRADACGVGRNVDNPALAPLDHVGQHRLMHVEGADQIDRNELAPEIRIGVDERAEHIPAGIVDEHVDQTERLAHRRDRLIDVCTIRDVAGKRLRGTAVRSNRSGDILGGIEVDVANRHLGSRGCEPPGGRTAYAASTAGDGHHLAFQSPHHILHAINVVSRQRHRPRRHHIPRQPAFDSMSWPTAVLDCCQIWNARLR